MGLPTPRQLCLAILISITLIPHLTDLMHKGYINRLFIIFRINFSQVYENIQDAKSRHNQIAINPPFAASLIKLNNDQGVC